ncbi:MAG: alpha/beta hydrolase [Promethearchaeota archaeon]
MTQNIIFIHGLESSGDGFKGLLLRKQLPGCLTPSFKPYIPKISIKKLLNDRMEQLIPILKDKTKWIIIGSSFGGLMGVLFTLKYPLKVSKLILLAPFLSISELIPKNFSPVNIPVIVFHGKNDNVVSINQSLSQAEILFKNLKYNIVDDDHSLHNTVEIIDWQKLIQNI